jgi:hypothetical protein
VQALCTNRDLVLHMPAGLGQSDFSLNIAGTSDQRPDRQRPEPSLLGDC